MIDKKKYSVIYLDQNESTVEIYNVNIAAFYFIASSTSTDWQIPVLSNTIGTLANSKCQVAIYTRLKTEDAWQPVIKNEDQVYLNQENNFTETFYEGIPNVRPDREINLDLIKNFTFDIKLELQNATLDTKLFLRYGLNCRDTKII